MSGATRPDGRAVVVIGAGIVGLCCAIVAQARGFQVTVIDRGEPAAATSRGNAGGIATSDILPLASPGIIRKAPRWLLDPLGPLSIRPRYLPQLLPWLWRFWRASTPAQVQRSTVALAALNQLSWQETLPLYRAAGVAGHLHQRGSIQLYHSERAFQAAAPGWAARAAHGIAFRHLEPPTLHELEPALAPRFPRATLVPGWCHVSDPYRIGQAFAALTRTRGGSFRKAAVRGLEATGARTIRVHLEEGGQIDAGHLVVAAGAWSHRLSGNLGEPVPLETERGYNTTLPQPGVELTRMLIFGDDGFVISPLEIGLRVGGRVELGGLDLPPDHRRTAAMLAKAKWALPDLDTRDGEVWMGFRPSLPDSLPVISRSARHPGVLYAFGHGHLGLTQAPATGHLIGQLLADQTPSIDLTPFRVDRF